MRKSALKLEELFGIDLRSLAIFRIGVAFITLVDLADRAVDLVAHYTDLGILPRSVLLQQFPSAHQVSLHLISGSRWVEAGLFAIAFFSASCLLLGYRTRLASFITWFMTCSVQVRNPLVNFHADILLRLLLFWGLFLPWGALYSLDSLQSSRKKTPHHALSAGTAALLLQVAFVYFFTAVHKTSPVWWREGSAISEALRLGQFVTPTGRFLLRFPTVLKYMTFIVIWLERLGPLFLFIPMVTGEVRILVVFCFWALHIGLGTCLHLGHFPWVSAVAMIPFLPGRFWNRLSGSSSKRRISFLTASWNLNLLALFFLGYIFLWNLGEAGLLHLPPQARSVAYLFHIDQDWRMFSPHPPTEDGWFVISGKLEDGTELDPFRAGKPVSWEKPKNEWATYRNIRWERALWRMGKPNDQTLVCFSEYLCRDWNGKNRGGKSLQEIGVYFMKEDTLLEGESAQPEKTLLLQHRCVGEK